MNAGSRFGTGIFFGGGDSVLTKQQEERLQAARATLAKGEAASAIADLTLLDQEVDHPAVNQLLARALVTDHQYQAAGRVIEHRLADYSRSPALVDLVIKVMLTNQHYLALRQFLTPLAGVTKAQWVRVEASERVAEQELSTTLATRQRHFIHLGDRGFRDQQARFRAALDLPLTQFVMAAKFVLRDPAAHPLIKAAILQVLQQVGQKGGVIIEWLDGQEHSINLANLRPVDQDPAAQAGLRWLAAHYQNDDPQSYQLYCREFLLQLTLLYPLIAETITPVAVWMQALTTPQNSNESKALTAARQWQQRLAGIVAALA